MGFFAFYWVIFTVLSGACGAGSGAHGPSAVQAAAPLPSDRGAGAPDQRRLPPGATFADLVARANSLDQDDRGDSAAECLLRRPARPGAGWRLEGALVPAVRPLPAVPADLDRVLQSDRPLLVLSRWSELGGRPYAAALALFTDLPLRPGAAVTVLVLTDQGWYLRPLDPRDDRGAAARRPWPVPSDLGPSLEGHHLVLTAEGSLPLRRLGQVLAALPPRVPVSLAVVLAEELQVPPRPPAPPDRGTGLCPDGLPVLAGDVPRGELTPEELLARVRPLGGAFQACLAGSPGLRAPAGRVEVALRIDETGKVADACLLADELGGTPWRHCLLDALRPLRFPEPRPLGTLDVILPLRLEPRYARGLCEQ